MVSRICPGCGKELGEEDVIIENLCQDCYLENADLLSDKREVEIKICKRCGKIQHKMEFERFKGSREEKIKKYISKYPNFLLKPEGNITRIEFKKMRKAGEDRYKAEVVIYGRLKEKQTKPIQVDTTIRIKINEFFCKKCKQIKEKRYQAKIQVRGKKIDLSNPLFKNKGLIDVREKKKGWDLYFLRNRKAKIVARRLKEDYNGTLSQHPKLIGEKNGERIYRYTYSLRI